MGVFRKILLVGNGVVELKTRHRVALGQDEPVGPGALAATVRSSMDTFAFEPHNVKPPHGAVVPSLHAGLELILGVRGFWSLPPSINTPQRALILPLPRTCTAFRSFASARTCDKCRRGNRLCSREPVWLQ